MCRRKFTKVKLLCDFLDNLCRHRLSRKSHKSLTLVNLRRHIDKFRSPGLIRNRVNAWKASCAIYLPTCGPRTDPGPLQELFGKGSHEQGLRGIEEGARGTIFGRAADRKREGFTWERRATAGHNPDPG